MKASVMRFGNDEVYRIDTQKKWVAQELLKNGRISRNTALKNYVSRLGAIMAQLKDIGVQFNTKESEVLTPWGDVGSDYVYEIDLDDVPTNTLLKSVIKLPKNSRKNNVDLSA